MFFFFLMFPQHDIYLWLCSSSVVGAFMPLTLSHPAVPALCVYGAFVLHTAHSKMSYYFSFIFFQTDEGVEGLSSSASASLSLFSPFGSSKDSQLRLPLSLPIFYPSFRMQHHNQCYCSLAPPLAPLLHLSFTSSPSFLSLLLFPFRLHSCYLLLVKKKKKNSDTSSDPLQCVFFSPPSSSYMVISLQISAVSGRVLPSCLDHSALICEAAELLRTAEHASLEWIYALGEAQGGSKKRYYV